MVSDELQGFIWQYPRQSLAQSVDCISVVPFRIDPVKITIILGIYLLMYLENMIFYTFDCFFSIAHSFVSLFVIGKCLDLAAFTFVIGEHLWEFLQIITGDTV